MVSDQVLLLAVAASAITLLLGILVIAVRTRTMSEQLAELDAQKRSVHDVHRALAHVVRVSDRTFAGLQGLSGFGLHFRQIKREQLRLSAQLEILSSALEALAKRLERRDEIKVKDKDEIKEIVEASRSLEEWKSRMTALYSDAGYLFESEPIRELLIEQFGPQHRYATERPGRSEEGTKSNQKRVRPRRQR